jgi:hypothetical protein
MATTPNDHLEHWKVQGNQNFAHLGWSSGTAGDVNGDGFDDVIVGAYGYDDGQTDEGEVFVYLGSASGPSTTPDWTAQGNDTGGFFGWSVATAGDVNGDGYDDVIVGSPYHDNGQYSVGEVFVFLGSASGLGTTPAWTVQGDQASEWFGISVATAGDVNGDGFDDVIVGAPYFTLGAFEEGRAFVYLGSASGLTTTLAWTIDGRQPAAHLGFSVATAGDVNGDGFDEVVVGAPHYDNGQDNEGRALLFMGSPAGPGTTPAWTAESNHMDADLGLSVASAGDVNGDGFGDVIVGAPQYDNGQDNEGRAFAFLGSASGLGTAPAWAAESNQGGANFGWSVATAGDMNGDGFGDVIVGAPQYDNGQADEGRAFVYLGSASGLGTGPARGAEADRTGANTGYSVATAGDLNNDGLDEVIIGAPGFGDGQDYEGMAIIFQGRSPM